MQKYWQVLFENEGNSGANGTEAPVETKSEAIAETKTETPVEAKVETPVVETPAAPAEKPWYQSRIDQITREKYDLGVRIGELERQLAAKAAPAGEIDENEVNRRAQAIAQHMATANDFNAKCNSAFENGMKSHTDFEPTLTMLRSVCGGVLPTSLVEAALETGQAHEVLYELGKNPEKAMEMVSLSPLQMATRVARMGLEYGPKTKATTKAPEPIRPTVGGRGSPGPVDIADTSIPMADFIKEREKQLAEKRR